MLKNKILNTVHHLLLLLFLISGSSSFAQSKSHWVKGVVMNKDSKPIAFASALLLQKDTLITATTTDEKGRFELRAKSGEYTLQIQQFDSLLYTKTISLQADSDFEKIKIDASVNLDEVIVQSQKKILERKADRLRFNVENLPIKDYDGYEIIKQTPGLLVQNESISIIGKKGIRVMVDGKMLRLTGEALLNYLKNIEGNQIKAIEVITNPPAKYSAEGNSGLLNIILKKTENDYWSNSITGSTWQSTHTSYSLSDHFYYKKDKLSFGASVNLTKDNPYSVVKKDLFYPDYLFDEEMILTPKTTYFNPKFGVDYQFNDRITMGFQADYFKSDSDRRANDEVRFFDSTHQLDSLSTNKSTVIDEGRNYALNYHLIFNLDSLDEKKLRFDVDYLGKKVNQNNRNHIENHLVDQEIIQETDPVPNTKSYQNNKGYFFKLDMIHPMGKLHVNYGTDLSFIDIANKVAYHYVNADEISDPNRFHYSERTQSAYISANRDVGEKWEVQLGLRAEYTQTKGHSASSQERNKTTDLSLFPTGYIAYNLSPKHSFTANYGRRINRPFFMFLNPYPMYLSQYQYSVGNPNLTPSFSQNLELNYLFDQSLNIQLYYSRTSDEFDYLQFATPDHSIIYERPENYAKSDIYGLNLFYSFTTLKWWQSLTSFNYNHASTASYIPEAPMSLKGHNAFFNLNNTFKITDKLSFNANYYYFFSGVSELTHNAARNYLDVRLSLALMADQLNISLSSQDIFKSNRYRSYTYSNGIRMNSDILTNNHIKLLLRYKFGNKKMGSYQYEYNEKRNRM